MDADLMEAATDKVLQKKKANVVGLNMNKAGLPPRLLINEHAMHWYVVFSDWVWPTQLKSIDLNGT